MKNVYVLLPAILFFLSSPAQIYQNSFTGPSACPTNGNIPTVAPNATGAPLTRSSITCATAANVFNSSTLNNTAAVVSTSYIEFSITADPGFQLNLQSLSFFRQGSATAPNQLEVRYSTDNFATFITWGNTVLTPTTGSVLTWDFGDLSLADGATVTFRFYPYGTQRCDLAAGNASAGGSFRLDDVMINGSITAPGGALPEPSNQVTAFACGTITSHSIPLTWIDATGSTLPSGYLIKWSSVSYAAIGDPVDGIPEADVSSASAGIVNINYGLQTKIIDGLTSATTYYFEIFPYSNSGAAIDYKTNGAIPQTSCTTAGGDQNAVLAGFDLTGNNTAAATFAATSINPGLSVSPDLNTITRGPGAAASAANNSFRSSGFKNDGLSVTNTDYFQVQLAARAGYNLSLSSIDANLNGTASFAVSPGVFNQFAYSLDGTNFILIASPVITIGQPAALATIDVSTVAGLQNLPSTTTVILRYYASGQTTTGGWGFFSPSAGINGLAIAGSVLSQTLAVNFAHVRVSLQSNKVHLQWSNMTEEDVLHYDIGHSQDGQSFISIADVNAKLNNGGEADYDFIIDNPSPGIHYYRINSLESSGNAVHSPIMKITVPHTENSLVLYPNPRDGDLIACQMSQLAKGKYSISVFNLQGQLIYSKTFDHPGGTLSQTVRLACLRPGMYWLRLSGTGVALTKMFVQD